MATPTNGAPAWRKYSGIAIAVAFVVFLAACGNGGASGGSNNAGGTSSFSPDQGDQSAGSPSAPVPGSPSAPAPASGGSGSGSAPIAAQPGSQGYQDFLTTVQYETDVQSDYDLGQQTVHGVLGWYYWGVQVCQNLSDDPSATPEVVATGLASQAGYTGAGAEAVVAGAVRDLCPSLGLGFTTAMDGRVQLAQANMDQALGGVDLPTMAVGYFAKIVCSYFEDGNGGQLMAYLQSHSVMPEPQDNSINYDETTTKKAVVAAASGFCPGASIPGGWLT